MHLILGSNVMLQKEIMHINTFQYLHHVIAETFFYIPKVFCVYKYAKECFEIYELHSAEPTDYSQIRKNMNNGEYNYLFIPLNFFATRVVFVVRIHS